MTLFDIFCSQIIIFRFSSITLLLCCEPTRAYQRRSARAGGRNNRRNNNSSKHEETVERRLMIVFSGNDQITSTSYHIYQNTTNSLEYKCSLCDHPSSVFESIETKPCFKGKLPFEQIKPSSRFFAWFLLPPSLGLLSMGSCLPVVHFCSSTYYIYYYYYAMCSVITWSQSRLSHLSTHKQRTLGLEC